MDIISQFADKAHTEALLNENTDLKRFAFEFCTAFNCKVMRGSSTRPPSLLVLTPNGMVAGSIRVSTGVNKANEDVTVYYYHSRLVSKDKGSARSDSNTRDSTKISTLISSVRKNGEGPSEQKLGERFHRGLDYAFNMVSRNRNNVTMQIGQDELLAAIKYALGLDTHCIELHTASLTESYHRYMQDKKRSDQAQDDRQRFNEGCYAVGFVREHTPHVIFTEVTHDGNHAAIQAPLKRYAKVADIPEMAGHLPIIRTWAEGAWANHKDENDFGLPIRDTYYPEIDVATGYETHTLMWVLIPKKGA